MKADYLPIPEMHDAKLNFGCEESCGPAKIGTLIVKSLVKNNKKESNEAKNSVKTYLNPIKLISRMN